jgi:lactate racemase
MPRPGFVLEVDKSTPPTLFWRGEGFSLEKLPADRSRIIYPPEPLPRSTTSTARSATRC